MFSQGYLSGNGEKVLVYAHSNLAGTNLYDLKVGSIIKIYFYDEEIYYRVNSVDVYIAKSNIVALEDGDIKLRREGAGDWISLMDILLSESIHKGEIIFMTCYASNKGFGGTSGRLIIRVSPLIFNHPLREGFIR